jgi:hypothetical protein
MMLTIISYIAGGGGNHLKNLMCLHQGYSNSSDLDLSIYHDRPLQPPGTVHSVGGRNISDHVIDRVLENPQDNWLLHGHWGELMPYRQSLSGQQIYWLLLSLDQETDRSLVKTRHERLHQHPHPYWLDEEQIYLYQPEMYLHYFHANPENIFSIGLTEFWHPDITHHNLVQKLNDFFQINIDQIHAKDLHKKWWEMNFNFHFDDRVRRFYTM